MMDGVQSGGALGQVEFRNDELDRAVKPAIAGRASRIDGVGRPVRSEPQPGVNRYVFPADYERRVAVWRAYDSQARQVEARPRRPRRSMPSAVPSRSKAEPWPSTPSPCM